MFNGDAFKAYTIDTIILTLLIKQLQTFLLNIGGAEVIAAPYINKDDTMEMRAHSLLHGVIFVYARL
jgi:hypothetical protein